MSGSHLCIPRNGIHKWDFRSCAGILIVHRLIQILLTARFNMNTGSHQGPFSFPSTMTYYSLCFKKVDYKTDKRTNGNSCYTVNRLRTRVTKHNKARSNRNPSLWPFDQWGAVLQFVRVRRRAGVGGSLAVQGNRGAGLPHQSWGDIRR